MSTLKAKFLHLTTIHAGVTVTLALMHKGTLSKWDSSNEQFFTLSVSHPSHGSLSDHFAAISTESIVVARWGLPVHKNEFEIWNSKQKILIMRRRWEEGKGIYFFCTNHLCHSAATHFWPTSLFYGFIVYTFKYPIYCIHCSFLWSDIITLVFETLIFRFIFLVASENVCNICCKSFRFLANKKMAPACIFISAISTPLTLLIAFLICLPLKSLYNQRTSYNFVLLPAQCWIIC